MQAVKSAAWDLAVEFKHELSKIPDCRPRRGAGLGLRRQRTAVLLDPESQSEVSNLLFVAINTLENQYVLNMTRD